MIRVKLRSAMKKYEARTGERLTYQDLAERTGLSVTTLQSIGAREEYNTTLSTVDVICEALECRLAEILEFESRSKHR